MAIELPEKPAELETPKARAYKVIGTRPVRPDGADKVTGRAVYGADIRLTGMLRGRVLRSPHSHARILSVDTSKAEALPGVKAVVTGRDWPALADKFEDTGEDVVNLSDLGHNLLAVDKVLYKGHAVAAVAAIDDGVAQQALSLIEVQYEPLPAVFDVRESMKAGAPLLSNKRFTDEMGKKAEKPSNIGRHARFDVGNLEQGFAQADVVLEHEYRTQMVHQGYIEPHTSTAYWNMDGSLTVWTSTQGAFGVRDTL
ncbi:MAG TPA: molybdopterin cofactor-binding domain-containing protein, partial [Chloroflexota bacterium]|nr:molybdopterin cofactor-binding domain-containing protein [Chloroflexota bacterium]